MPSARRGQVFKAEADGVIQAKRLAGQVARRNRSNTTQLGEPPHARAPPNAHRARGILPCDVFVDQPPVRTRLSLRRTSRSRFCAGEPADRGETAAVANMPPCSHSGKPGAAPSVASDAASRRRRRLLRLLNGAPSRRRLSPHAIRARYFFTLSKSLFQGIEILPCMTADGDERSPDDQPSKHSGAKHAMQTMPPSPNTRRARRRLARRRHAAGARRTRAASARRRPPVALTVALIAPRRRMTAQARSPRIRVRRRADERALPHHRPRGVRRSRLSLDELRAIVDEAQARLDAAQSAVDGDRRLRRCARRQPQRKQTSTPLNDQARRTEQAARDALAAEQGAAARAAADAQAQLNEPSRQRRRHRRQGREARGLRQSGIADAEKAQADLEAAEKAAEEATQALAEAEENLAAAKERLRGCRVRRSRTRPKGKAQGARGARRPAELRNDAAAEALVEARADAAAAKLELDRACRLRRGEGEPRRGNRRRRSRSAPKPSAPSTRQAPRLETAQDAQTAAQAGVDEAEGDVAAARHRSKKRSWPRRRLSKTSRRRSSARRRAGARRTGEKRHEQALQMLSPKAASSEQAKRRSKPLATPRAQPTPRLRRRARRKRRRTKPSLAPRSSSTKRRDDRQRRRAVCARKLRVLHRARRVRLERGEDPRGRAGARRRHLRRQPRLDEPREHARRPALAREVQTSCACRQATIPNPGKSSRS